MKTFKPGDIIKIEKKAGEAFQSRFDRIGALRNEVQSMLITINEQARCVWDDILKMYPEGKNHNCSFDNKKNKYFLKVKGFAKNG